MPLKTIRPISPLNLQIDHGRRATRTLEIAQLYANDVPIFDICERYRISRTQVHRIVKLCGVPLRPRGFKESIRNGVIAELELGKPYNEISAKFGVSEAYCSLVAKDCGLQRYRKKAAAAASQRWKEES